MLTTFGHDQTTNKGKGPDLAARITYTGSKQTFYTFRLLVDRERKQDAYRSYAYFRWLDDQIDSDSGSREEKLELIQRQRALMDACYRGETPPIDHPEEKMLLDLVRNDHEEDSGLKIYLYNMLKVMAFDAERRGRVISHAELTEYTHWLATGVTEDLFYFIGHKDTPPCGETRYQAVCGAHVVHMLRDCLEDISNGYFNVPGEFIQEQNISLEQLHSLSFRKWVYGRIKLARQYFAQGREYFTQVKSVRCRLACAAYLARFEWMLNRIEQDRYYLRPAYPERKSLKAALWMAWRVLTSIVNIHWMKPKPGEQMPLLESTEE